MRECHLGACPGRNEQYLDCRKRSAYHEAGHALLQCLVAAQAESDRAALPADLTFGYGYFAKGGAGRLENEADNPWNDVLVLLGGPAADAVVYRDLPLEMSGDCARAERLLQGMQLRLDVADVFEATKELVEHHRGLLEALMGAVYPRGFLAGSDMWRLFQTSLHEPYELREP